MRRITTYLAAFVLALSAIPAAAQSLTGGIEGVVRDEQGGALPGVSLTLTGKRGSQTTLTDAVGSYRFAGIDPGTFSVTAELSGFRTKRQENVVVGIGRQVRSTWCSAWPACRRRSRSSASRRSSTR